MLLRSSSIPILALVLLFAVTTGLHAGATAEEPGPVLDVEQETAELRKDLHDGEDERDVPAALVELEQALAELDPIPADTLEKINTAILAFVAPTTIGLARGTFHVVNVAAAAGSALASVTSPWFAAAVATGTGYAGLGAFLLYQGVRLRRMVGGASP
jgi:hypothetical protein